MHLDWTPDAAQLQAYAVRSGVPLSELSPDAISGFVVHHDAKGLAKTESQWIADLIAWRKRDLANAAKVVQLRAGAGGPPLDDSDTSWNDVGGAR